MGDQDCEVAQGHLAHVTWQYFIGLDKLHGQD